MRRRRFIVDAGPPRRHGLPLFVVFVVLPRDFIVDSVRARLDGRRLGGGGWLGLGVEDGGGYACGDARWEVGDGCGLGLRLDRRRWDV